MMPVRRYDVLDMLADQMSWNRMGEGGMSGYLGRKPGSPEQAIPYGVNPEMNEQPRPTPLGDFLSEFKRRLPPDLPEAVQRSILGGQSSYGEGEMQEPPWSAPWNRYSDFERENELNYETWVQGKGRAARLPYELGMGRQFPEMGIPLGEGLTARPSDTPDPYSPRPNLGLGRGYPWALY